MKYWGWPLYFMVVGLLLFAAFFTTVSTARLISVREFIHENKDVLWSLGTLFLVAFLTLVTTGVANASADAQKKADRVTAAEIEIAKFRQSWIDNLRKLLSQVIHVSSEVVAKQANTLDSEGISKLHELDVQIRLMLNPREDEAILLSNQVTATILAAESTQLHNPHSTEAMRLSERFYSARELLTEMSAKYIKAEWDVTKSVLKSAKRDWT